MFTKAITFNRETKDFDAIFDGQYIGSFATRQDAQDALDAHAYDLLRYGLVGDVTLHMSDEDTNPVCPICGAPMRQTRRGATLRKRGPAYICPADEAETVADTGGRLSRVPGARHAQSRRVYEAYELNSVL